MRNNRNSGFTLVEVLVTVVILAIGLLGLAGLQVNGLLHNTTAYERSQAIFLAYDIIDRMRANRENVADYATALDIQPTNTNCFGTAADCTPAEIAAFDLNQWKCSLGKWVDDTDCIALDGAGIIDSTGKLSNGDGSISIDAGNDTVTVTIRWEENRDDDANRFTSLAVTTLI